MFISSKRISVYTEPLDTWVLKVESVVEKDEGVYDCHLNQDPPVKMSLYLTVRGRASLVRLYEVTY